MINHDNTEELNGQHFVLVEWPESQDYMDLPGAFLIENPDVAGRDAYMVPAHIYENTNPEDHDDYYDDSMCGDHESALASVGWGSEEF